MDKDLATKMDGLSIEFSDLSAIRYWWSDWLT